MTRKDPVRPEDARAVLRRDGGCVVGFLYATGKIARAVGPCSIVLTVAHVRDRGKGGRMAKRPPSVRRHLAATCSRHHLDDPIVDRPEVRDAVDAYLEEKEGPDQDDGNRPHEAIARVRSARSRDAGILASAGSDRQEERVDPDGT